MLQASTDAFTLTSELATVSMVLKLDTFEADGAVFELHVDELDGALLLVSADGVALGSAL